MSIPINIAKTKETLAEDFENAFSQEWQESVSDAKAMEWLLNVWNTEKIVLRPDPDFLAALQDTDTGSPIDPEALKRSPYSCFAFALPEPIETKGHNGTSFYYGFIVAGAEFKMLKHNGQPAAAGRPIPLGPDSIGVSIIWFFKDREAIGFHPAVMTLKESLTIGDLLQQMTPGIRLDDHNPALPDDLISLALLALMYVSSSEPDLETLAPQSVSRPGHLTKAKFINMGWRVGATLRSYGESVTSKGGSRSGGWNVRPHIRRAHNTRVRIATRDADGNIIGNRQGEFGVDWHYEIRWIPPTPINVGEEGSAPTVRTVH